jgi:hypothetical protein
MGFGDPSRVTEVLGSIRASHQSRVECHPRVGCICYWTAPEAGL